MKNTLTNYATISSGQTFRKKVVNDPDGDVWVIQIKDLNENQTGLRDLPHSVTQNEVSKKQLLKKGDVLFLAKGANNSAWVYDYDQKAVAVSMFFVIRPNEQLNSTYLCWYLNRKSVQSHLKSMREGAVVGNIKKSVLEDLVIEVPPLEKQKSVAKLYGLSKREEKISHELVEIRKEYIDNLLTSCIS